MTIWCKRIACWKIKATDTHSEHVILIAFHCNNGYTNASQYYATHILYSSLCFSVSIWSNVGKLRTD